MELTGEHRIPAPRKRVWDALNDPEVLKECIKGCQRLEKTDDRSMVATVQAKVGPVKATFDATVEIVDPVEPESYTLVGEGKGGVAGFAKGKADVKLTEDGEDTILTYHANANVGGKLAQLGSRLVDTTAKKYAADFFEAFSQKVGGAEAAPTPAPAAMPSEDDATFDEERIEEGLDETELALEETPVDSAHVEDTIENEIEEAAASGRWGGPYVWGILAFAVVILVLIALR